MFFGFPRVTRAGGAQAGTQFGTLPALRNSIATLLSRRARKQAEILKEVHKRSGDRIEGYNEVLVYADKKFFSSKLDIHPIPTDLRAGVFEQGRLAPSRGGQLLNWNRQFPIADVLCFRSRTYIALERTFYRSVSTRSLHPSARSSLIPMHDLQRSGRLA